jgi:hypothetical protein
MKTFKLIIIIALTVSTLTSCQFTEEINFDTNGGGKYNLNIDMSSMINMMGSMQDSTDNAASEKLDTILYMKDLLDDNKKSISDLSTQEQASFEMLKDIIIHVKMDKEAEIFKTDFSLDFKSVSQLDNIEEKIKLAQKLQENKVEESEPTNHKISYTYSKKKFERKVEMLKLSAEEQAKFDESLKSSASVFLEGSTYKIKYNFPKKIKSTSLVGAVISEDKKTLTFEMEMKKVIEEPKLLEFEVKF